jgi:carbamate kinase
MRIVIALGGNVARTGHRAAIGSLADIPGIVTGTAGTNVVVQPA